jgi:hypothetical protein
VITGLYPPSIGTTPSQANLLSTIMTIAGYVLVVAVLIVPLLLFRRYAKAHRKELQDAIARDEEADRKAKEAEEEGEK